MQVVKSTAAWKFVRAIKRSVLNATSSSALPANACRGEVVWLDPPPCLEAGSRCHLNLKVQNRSGVPWHSTGRHPVRLRSRWVTCRNDPFDVPPTFAALPRTLFPGEPQSLTIAVPTPDVVGDFTLEIDFVRVDDIPFAEVHSESKAVRLPVPVIGPRTTDIDYHEVFRTANLDDNHWWVVGAYHSKEQYERSSRERLEMLVKRGLTPNSRVLDIGCGTGQMASAMKDYLTDRGAYFGTDIGKEAIDFCQRTFHRKNFAFRQGGMTTVPFDASAGAFDFAIFFSVFTHTFLDETALLMAEARRLLKPSGAMIADVITSPLVERAAGHRGEMVVNEERFLELANMLGYRAEIIGRWPWNRHAERFMFELRQRN